MRDTRPLLIETDFPPLRRSGVSSLQVNLGYLCNLSCTHCHVNAGPTRTELMSRENIDRVLEVLSRREVEELDLTGGAPEMNPHFRYLVSAARAMGVRVIDRCNLTILLEPGYEDLIDFMASEGVSIVASLPCYSEDNVDQQRGKGVFGQSIQALQQLNEAGYGKQEGLSLSLVYNPVGAYLPPSQEELEQQYKQVLMKDFGIVFDQLLTITNMPISRFGAVLLAKGEYEAYMSLLKNSFSAGNLSTVMCRNTVSVDWQGFLYDCDFNQMLDFPLNPSEKSVHIESAHIASDRRLGLEDLLKDSFVGHSIRVAEHCYGCTAGQGSSCSGALGNG